MNHVDSSVSVRLSSASSHSQPLPGPLEFPSIARSSSEASETATEGTATVVESIAVAMSDELYSQLKSQPQHSQQSRLISEDEAEPEPDNRESEREREHGEQRRSMSPGSNSEASVAEGADSESAIETPESANRIDAEVSNNPSILVESDGNSDRISGFRIDQAQSVSSSSIELSQANTSRMDIEPVTAADSADAAIPVDSTGHTHSLVSASVRNSVQPSASFSSSTLRSRPQEYPGICCNSCRRSNTDLIRSFMRLSETSDSTRSRSPPSLARCSGCRAVFYCCRGCQKNDWTRHKTFCRHVRQMEESGLGFAKFIQREGRDDSKPQPGQLIKVHFVGKLPNGNIFDRSFDIPCRNDHQSHNESNELPHFHPNHPTQFSNPHRLSSTFSFQSPFQFRLGRCEVIYGLDLAIAQMKRGERAMIIISAEFAYGDNGMHNIVPPKSPLIFELELIDFHDPIQSTTGATSLFPRYSTVDLYPNWNIYERARIAVVASDSLKSFSDGKESKKDNEKANQSAAATAEKEKNKEKHREREKSSRSRGRSQRLHQQLQHHPYHNTTHSTSTARPIASVTFSPSLAIETQPAIQLFPQLTNFLVPPLFTNRPGIAAIANGIGIFQPLPTQMQPTNNNSIAQDNSSGQDQSNQQTI